MLSIRTVLLGATGIIIALLVALSLPLRMAAASEPILDSELENLYGGWNWFNNPYCGYSAHNCPEHTECNGWAKCRFCVPEIGELCFDDQSWWPDPGGCDDGNEPCQNMPWVPQPDIPNMYGFCSLMECIAEYQEAGHSYPDCSSEGRYDWCDD